MWYYLEITKGGGVDIYEKYVWLIYMSLIFDKFDLFTIQFQVFIVLFLYKLGICTTQF